MSKKHSYNPETALAAVRSQLTSEINDSVTDDACLRYLRAKNGDVAKATEMAKFWSSWFPAVLPGSKYSPKTILSEPDCNEHIYREFMPHSNLGEDKKGHPICK